MSEESDFVKFLFNRSKSPAVIESLKSEEKEVEAIKEKVDEVGQFLSRRFEGEKLSGKRSNQQRAKVRAMVLESVVYIRDQYDEWVEYDEARVLKELLAKESHDLFSNEGLITKRGKLRKRAFKSLVELVAQRYSGLPMTEIELICSKLFRFDNPRRVDPRSLQWSMGSYKSHLLIVDKLWDPAWFYAALYFADHINRDANLSCKVAIPLHFVLSRLQKREAERYSNLLVHQLDLPHAMDQRTSVWLWNVSSTAQWFCESLWDQILKAPMRLQVVAKDRHYHFSSDQVLNLSESPHDFVFGFAQKNADPELLSQSKFHSQELVPV